MAMEYAFELVPGTELAWPPYPPDVDDTKEEGGT